MADNDKTIEVSPKFLDFLRNSPEMLAMFAKIINEWLKVIGELPLPGDGPLPISPTPPERSGPIEYHADQEIILRTQPISHSDIDAVEKEYAEAIVIERVIAQIKAVIATGMFVVRFVI